MIDNWRKATYSANNATCVETGWASGTVGYRDTKQAALPADERPALLFGTDAARAFLSAVKAVS